MPGFIYLASPYSHPDSRVRACRYWEILNHAADIMATGRSVYSPIVHGHNVAELLHDDLLLDHEFWLKQCTPMLEAAAELWVMQLDGWAISKGIAKEIQIARSREIPIKYIP